MTFTRKAFLLSGFILLIANSLFADTEQMNTTLARINKILTQINPLINAAQDEQDPDARVKFQFDTLRSDIGKIQAGIAQQINLPSIQPRSVEPLSGDYLSDKDRGG